MRKVSIIAFLTAASAAVFSCAPREIIPESHAVQIEFISDAPATRTAFTSPSEGKYPVVWQEGDEAQLLVNGSVPSGGVSVLRAVPSADGSNASFSGSVVTTEAAPYTFTLISPSIAFKESASGKVRIEIPGEQRSTSASPDPFSMVLRALCGPYEQIPAKARVSFSHVTGYLHLTITGTRGEPVSATLSCGKPLAGVFALDPTSGALTPADSKGSVKVLLQGNNEFFASVAPCDLSQTDLTINVVTTAATYEKTITFPSGRNLASGAVASFAVDMSGSQQGKSSLFDESKIVLSFAAITDTHIDGVSTDAGNKLSQALSQLNAKASEKDANGLDMVVVAGDLTDTPSQSSTQMGYFKTIYEAVFDPEKVPMIYTVGNHDVNPGYRWSTSTVSQARVFDTVLGDKYFKTDTDNTARVNMECRDCLVGGYHVLCVTPNGNCPVSYDASVISWLDERLKAITGAEPEKFVFVNTHPMIDGTVYGSLLGTPSGVAISDIWESSAGDYWSTRALTPVLSKYPQAVTFGGHLHFPLHDPRSIWQGAFTAFGCGSTRYMAVENGKYENMQSATVMTDSYRVSDGWLMQMDENGNMRATAMDFSNRSPIGSPYEISYPVSDKSHLAAYNNELRAQKNHAPEFDAAGLQVETTQVGISTKVVFKWNSASDDEFVHHYILTLTKDGQTVLRKKYMTDFYRHPNPSGMKKEWSVEAGFLSSGTYVVTLLAEDSWGAAVSLAKAFTIENSGPLTPEVYADFSFSSSASDAKGKVSVTNHGASFSSMTMNYKGQSHTFNALLAGADKYVLCQFNEIASTDEMSAFMSGGFAVEAIFADRAPGKGSASVHGIVCGTQAGGWGLATRATGVPYFIIGQSSYNTYKSVDAASAISSSNLSHVFCVYDPSAGKILIYVNGALSAYTAVPGSYFNGAGDCFNRFCLGADIAPGGVGTDFPCTDVVIGAARLWIGAPDAAAVKAAYDASESLLK